MLNPLYKCFTCTPPDREGAPVLLNSNSFVLVEALQCFSCDRNDIFSGLDTCGDVSIPTDQNTKTCSESFCMRTSGIMENRAEASQMMNCPGDIEMVLGNVGLTLHGFCGIRGSGCHPLPDMASSLIGTINEIEICCCTDNL